MPTNDYVFKRIFGRVGNEKITKGLLNAILDEQVKEIKGHTKWELREKDFSEIVLTEVCEIHIIELPKLKKLVKNGEFTRRKRTRDMEQIFTNSRRIGGNGNGKG